MPMTAIASGAWIAQSAGTGGTNSTRPVSSDLNLAFSPAYIDLNGTGNGEQLQYVGTRSGTKAELQAAIANTANWTAQDAPIGTSATSDFFASTAFSVTAMGAPPTVVINGGSTVLEGGVDTIISGELMTTDPDTALGDLTYTVTTTAPANGTLWVDTDGSGTINNAETALGVNGTFTQLDIFNGQLKYAHNSGETTSDSFGFKVADQSTEITGQTFNFTVTPQNDDPVISNLNGDGVSYFEGFPSVFLDVGFNAFVTDVDSTDFNGGSLTVSFVTGATADDQLGFNSTGSGPNEALLIDGTLVFVEGFDVGIVTSDGTAGTPFTISLNSANATPARISVLLKNLTYQNNAGDNPIGATRDVNVQLTDGDGGSQTAVVSLGLTPLNDNPTVTNAPTSVSVVENTASPVDLSSVVVADPDSASVTVKLTVTDGTFTTPADGSGVGSVADVGTGEDSIVVVVNDGNGSGDLQLATVSVDITPGNAAPTVSGTPTDVTVVEDTQSNLDLSSIELADADGDTLTLTLNISLGSFAQPADGAGVGVTEALDSSTQLRLIGTAAAINTYLDTASNIQYTGPLNANGQDQAVISGSVSDGTAAAVALPNINIDITAENDAPTATGVPTDIIVTEDTASNVDLSAVTFADVEGDALTVSLIAGNGAFSGTSSGGVVVGGSGTATLTLAGSVADINTYLDTASNIQYTGAFNLSGPDADTVNIRADDSTDDVLVGTFDIDITNTNDAPTLSGPLPVSISAVEDTPSNVDLSGVTFEDADGDTLTVTLAATSGVFTALDAGGVVVGSSGTGSMTLTGSGADINTYLDTVSSVQYTGPTDVFGPNAATFTINVSDTTVNPQFGPINISLSPVDDPAVAQDDGFLSTTVTKTVGNVFAANIGSADCRCGLAIGGDRYQRASG
ncbi:Extracellular matrix protein FRAS1 [Nymphon striatum]|nr:Extracellular matrix protein FRAS1 [Nymphon striatum]